MEPSLEKSKQWMDLKNRAWDVINKHPGTRQEVLDTLELCKCEIELGESVDNEIQLADNRLKEIAEEHEAKQNS